MYSHVRHVADLPVKNVAAFDGAIHLRNVLRPDSGGTPNLSINALEVPVGSGTPFHLHHHCEEAWVVTKGRGALRVTDDWYGFEAGDVLHCPKDTPHQVVNLGEEWLHYLAITAPAVDLETDNIVISQFSPADLDAARESL